jgi:hypothetical protein
MSDEDDDEDDCDELADAAQNALDSWGDIMDILHEVEDRADANAFNAGQAWAEASELNKEGDPLWTGAARDAVTWENRFHDLGEKANELESLEIEFWNKWVEANLKAINCIHKETTTSLELPEE